MKPLLENINKNTSQSSFHSFSYTTKSFDFKWHFHPEYELTYIVKGNGYRLVGNSHQEFSDDDFVLIGPNLPHTWCGKSEDDSDFEAIVIQMPHDFIEKITAFSETRHLKSFFDKANCGLVFNDYPKNIKEDLFRVVHTNGVEKINTLMNVLSRLSLYSSSALSSSIYKYQINEEVQNKVNKVCVFLQNNFSNPISLKEVADLIHMTESNFCKFFKKSTSTTFSNYLNELRINAACNLLLSSDNNIKNIAFSCGFESLSYFNRVFLKKKLMSPKEFRMKNSIE